MIRAIIMKVAILNRDPNAYPGGDVLSIHNIIEALGGEGVDAEYVHGHWTPDTLKEYDLVHIRHCNFGWSWFNFTQTWASRIPYVLTPMFYPTFKLGMTKEQIQEAVGRAKAIVPFAEAEWEEMLDMLGGVERNEVYYVPNGTSEKFHCDSPADNREGVLAVSARSGDKNTDRVRFECKEAGIPFTLAIGINPEDMPDVYKKHRVFINASDSERMSRTIGEGLCSGCRVLATKYNRGNSWYGGALVEIDPHRGDLMGARIIAAHSLWKDVDWNYSPNAVARTITWGLVAKKLKKIYEEALS